MADMSQITNLFEKYIQQVELFLWAVTLLLERYGREGTGLCSWELWWLPPEASAIAGTWAYSLGSAGNNFLVSYKDKEAVSSLA